MILDKKIRDALMLQFLFYFNFKTFFFPDRVVILDFI
jgi:hypothetical protein